MEIGIFGFIVLILAYFLFKPAVKNTVGMVNEGISGLALEFREPDKIAEMKKKFGCTDDNVKTMSDLLDWVNKRT